MRRWLLLAVLMLAGCGGDDGNGTGPDSGSIQVTVTTTGEDIPGNYSLTLDGVAVAQVAASGGITVPGVSAGLYAVGLNPIPAHCTAQGDNPVQVSVISGSQSQVVFAVQCGPQVGAISVTTVTTGERPDPDGYEVWIGQDDELAAFGSIGTNNQEVFGDLPSGTYSVWLTDLYANCTLQGENPQDVTVQASLTSSTTFNIDCPADANVDLPGTYELISVTQGGVTLGPAQGATGTLTLTQTTYAMNLTVPGPTGPINTTDSGTYWTAGSTWIQESATGGFQGVGTYSLVGDNLTIDVTTAGVQVLSVWNKL